MSDSEQSDNSEKEVVAVTKHGQATIPKRFREKLGIDAPGKVLFRETEDGTVIVEDVRSPSEMRGFAARSEASTEKSATEILREKRERDRNERDAAFQSEE
ncbi:AbrB family transcriptional regulator protein [Halorhabdus tiamatea SARL4B]|uniref:AbrB family transcriptional regulator protein n=1 Tax=Halorhabdus tiamatea SARL4B TaxID=1033806 RepID=F7PNY6_9EURY|nr:AbrB/MazE/SpoVT family DNA-binding domain-containing protein [Halorhabdus tiamatea]ERJ05350.1 AbrB family transcriptional regulator protein [Halorhabdus tiamatea SARL4B]CCQ33620.1 transcriptional regulator, AbrB family [Halorhabdus tiamatea SARL4B]